MKKITLSLSLALLASFSNAQNGLDSVIVEKYYVSDVADAASNSSEGVLPFGSVTYRVFVSLKPGYNFQAIYGNSASSGTHTLLINTTTSFFNNIDRGDVYGDKLTSTYLKSQTTALDSWLSVGATAGGQVGILKSKDDGVANLLFPHTPSSMLTHNDVSLFGIALSVQDGMVAGSPVAVTGVGDADANATTVFGPTAQGTSSYSITNGAISALGGAKGPHADSTRVLIGQFTTDGILHFELNIQIGTPGAGTQQYVANNPIGSEISIPSLTYTSPAISVGSPPTVTITAPASSATYTVGNTVTITATAASANSVIDSVTFFVDGKRVGMKTSSPYSYGWLSTVGTHTLTAVATDDNGVQTTSTPVIVASISTGISEITAVASFIAYPSPTTDILNIEINALQQINNAGYTIYDVIGNVILTKKLGIVSSTYKEAIDVSTFQKGLYIIKMVSDDLTLTKKIVIN